MSSMSDDGFNDVEPDWPAKDPEKGGKPAHDRNDLRLREKLGPDGWRKFLRKRRIKSQKSLEGPKEVPLEYRGVRPTFNFHVSSRTKHSYRDRYEQKQSPHLDDTFEDDTW